MNGEGFAFFCWHRQWYPGEIGQYCTTFVWAHRDYCLIKWGSFRNE